MRLRLGDGVSGLGDSRKIEAVVTLRFVDDVPDFFACGDVTVDWAGMLAGGVRD